MNLTAAQKRILRILRKTEVQRDKARKTYLAQRDKLMLAERMYQDMTTSALNARIPATEVFPD